MPEHQIQRAVRFIPARAGNTSARRARQCASAVHPRSRGEHPPVRTAKIDSIGSSPLARGTRSGRPREPPRRAVHPRSRGEHSIILRTPSGDTGSSPLARGTLAVSLPLELKVRFIPARAGNTAASFCARSTRPVHPRSRGEHVSVYARVTILTGSSPLARGTLEQRLVGTGGHRFIPARAGNTLPGTC